MQPRHIRPALFAALAALLLAAGLAPARVSVAEASEEPPEGETITTVLHPGWNMIGWVGPETAASELFGAIPQLQTVAMWNARTQQYTYSWRDLERRWPIVRFGTGLWLYIGGGTPVPWSRLALPHGVNLRLATGTNLVGVTADGAVNRFSDGARQAWRWDRARQRYEPYRFGESTLRRGEALWIEVSQGGNWARFGTAESSQERAAFESALEVVFGLDRQDYPHDLEAFIEAASKPLPHLADEAVRPVIEFLGDVPTGTRAAFQAEMERVHAFFIERFGAEPFEYSAYVAADDESARPTYYGIHRRWMFSSYMCHFRSVMIFHVMTCKDDLTYRSHIYQSMSQLLTNTYHSRQPLWLTFGGGTYAMAVYEVAEGLSSRDAEYRRYAGRARESAATLQELVSTEGWGQVDNETTHALLFLAIDWLTRHAGEHSLLEYYRLLPRGWPEWESYEARAGNWQAAFEQAFGLTIDEFYEQFEAYRATLQ